MKTKLRGFWKICAFAYTQSMKSKAMKVTMAVLCIIAVISMPLSSALSGSTKEAETTSIEKVYVYDNTGIIGEQFANKNITNNLYEGISYEMKESKDDIEDLINREDNKGEVFLVIEYSDNEESLNYGINICTYYGKESDVSSSDANDYSVFVEENVRKAVLKSAGTDEEDINKISKDIEYNVQTFNSDGSIAENDESISQFQYNFTIIFICLLIFMISFAGGKVSEIIVTEKATRVMEYILTSVKPMAILVGKVLSAMLMMLTILAGLAVSFVVSIFINNIMFPSDDGSIVLPGVLTDMVEKGAISGITPLNIILIIILLTAGCVFYGLVAGIAGATVSKIEEMAEGMKIFTFTMIVGAYLPLFLSMTNSVGETGWGTMTYVVYLLPISSIFILPQYLILGKVQAGIVVGAIGILIVSVVLLLLLVNKVYEHMLYSNGAPLKVKDIIKMAKPDKEEKC